MNILTMNRYDIQKAYIDFPHIVISMTDDDQFFPDIPEKNCKGVLRIAVWDTEDGVYFRSLYNFGAPRIPKDKIFHELHARRILEFVHSHLHEVEMIICQCDAGMSRSAGTAAALSKIFRGGEGIFLKPPYIPNKLIYETILNEYRHIQKLDAGADTKSGQA
ncbi:MAG: hypothetical protein AB1611_08715 [bacterium]